MACAAGPAASCADNGAPLCTRHEVHRAPSRRHTSRRTTARTDSRWRWRGSDAVARGRFTVVQGPPASPTRLALGPHEFAPEVLLRSQRIVRMTAQRQIVRSGGPTECVWVHMVKLEKSRLPTALASVIDVSASRAIALPHLAPHGRSNRLALALARIGWHTVSWRLALALARVLFGWLSISL